MSSKPEVTIDVAVGHIQAAYKYAGCNARDSA
jgi:hypothetical protein